MTQPSGRSAGKRIGGVAVMLLGAGVIGLGTHYLAINGTCSSTGYLATGPVPKCGGGEGFYITGTFFLGPLLALVGWGMAQLDGVLWPLVCFCLAAGLITIDLASQAAAGAKGFGLLAGVCFLALGVLSVVTTVRKRLRARSARPADLPPPGYADPAR